MDLSSVSSKELMSEIVARNIQSRCYCAFCSKPPTGSYKELIEAEHMPGWEAIQVGYTLQDGSFDVRAVAMVKVPPSHLGNVELRRFYGLMKKLRKALGVDLG